MNKSEFISQAFGLLNDIEVNVAKSEFLMGEDDYTLIKLCKNKDFQSLLYKMCKIKYPELSELWFRIDERETYIELKYKNIQEGDK